ncbi:MAG: hypothetical protein OER22_07080 [Gammaproteobacteria bacterium]|nr:hypothetical protein [Gammaproteobacteria bacterium]MDH3372041.1 hypothetical protein [Gammaproteobacteria bacterium]MDH3407838.1 hypothetical protein [Gammaproteobacteria bacterium]MDH3552362.1 hypothetical protein [Gammaproteobacteria bacterium]
MRDLRTTPPRLAMTAEHVYRLVRTQFVLATLLFAAPSAWSLELGAVLDGTTVAPPARVGFREERHNQMFKEPMILTGYLEYLQAGTLRKVIETPFDEAFLIEAGQVVIERDGTTRKLPLRKSKSLQTILGAIEAILSGDSEQLKSVFDVELDGSRESWSLQLTPTSRRIAKRLAGLQVAGNGQSVTSIRIDLKNDEWHLMELLRDDTPL